MLSQIEIEFFQSQGYLIVENVLTPGRIALLRSVAEEQRARARSARGENDLLEKNAYGAEPEVFRLSRVMERHPEFKNVALDPAICENARQLAGDDAEVCVNRHNMMMMKPPRVGGRVEWHQDAWNWSHDNVISFMVFLDDATADNGCLEIVPGAHRRGMLPSTSNAIGLGVDTANPDMRALVRQAMPVQVRAGDGLFFHSLMPHYSKANTSDRGRRNLVFAYVSAKDKRAAVNGKPMETIPLPRMEVCAR